MSLVHAPHPRAAKPTAKAATVVAFAVRRLGRLAAGVLVLLTVTFLIVQLIPGDPVRQVAGLTASQDYVDQLRHDFGLTRPLHVQYVDYVAGALTGDFGTSFRTKQPVADLLASTVPASASLALAAFVFTLALAVPLGLAMGALTAGGRRRNAQLAFTTVTGILSSVPGFLLAVGLVYVFGVANQWLPINGAQGPSSYVLPTLALSAAPVAALSRILRVQTVAVLEQDYIRTARSKRLPSMLLFRRHALPNLLTATLTIGGMLLPSLLGGSVVIENVFNWPGIGTQVVTAIAVKDYPVVQATVLILGMTVLVTNTLVDLMLAVIDPRSLVSEAP